jgi:arabinose-5-phosphate isomerase
VLTRECTTIASEALAAEALRLMESKSINGLLVVDAGGFPVGALNMHDLLRAGVM